MNLTHAFKTGLAAALTTAIYLAFDIPHGFWAVVSAVVVMQANVGSSLKASWARLLGTAVGAANGAAMASAANYFWPGLLDPKTTLHFDVTGLSGAALTALAAGLGVGLTGAFCVVLRLKDAYRLSAITCAIVLLVFAQSPWHSAMQRTLDVALGISIALTVSVFVLPSRARHQLASKLAEVLRDAGALCVELEKAYLMRCYPANEVGLMRDGMKEKFRDSRNLLNEAGNEPGRTAAEAHTLDEVFTSVERVLEHVLSLDEAARSSDPDLANAVELPRGDDLHREVSHEVSALVAAIQAASAKLADALEKRVAESKLPELEAALVALDARLLNLRQLGASRKLPLDEVMRFYMFVQALKALGRDLCAAAAKTEALKTRDPDPGKMTRRVSR